MANTVDTLGPEVLLRKIIDGSLEELVDETIQNTGKPFAFREMNEAISLTLNGYLTINNLREGEYAEIHIPKATSVTQSALAYATFYNDIALPSITNMHQPAIFHHTKFASDNGVIDIGTKCPRLRVDALNYSLSIKGLVLRVSDSICQCTSSIDASNTFGNSGSGGTIYIPKVLYDHLGDGSSLDYKAATNWSGADANNKITWAQIEGSEYEHYYADGTPISEGGNS